MPRTRARGAARSVDRLRHGCSFAQLLQSRANGFRVAVQSLRLGEQCRMRAERARCPPREYSCTVMILTKSFTLKPAAHARHAAGWQRVVRAGNVIAHRLRGPSAHEHRARVAHPLQILCANRR